MKDLNRVTTQEAILQALATIRDPDLGRDRDIVSLGLIKDLKGLGREHLVFDRVDDARMPGARPDEGRGARSCALSAGHQER